MSRVVEFDWGPPLEEYLQTSIQFPKPPASVEQAKASLLALSSRAKCVNLRDFDGISCSTLEDILSLMYHLTEIRALYTGITLQCFRLLELYTEHNKVPSTTQWMVHAI